MSPEEYQRDGGEDREGVSRLVKQFCLVQGSEERGFDVHRGWTESFSVSGGYWYSGVKKKLPRRTVKGRGR